jgi:hypothetical protein
VKELDFLPDWYKDRKRRHSRVRKQYLALVAVFLMMMTFNLTSLHRASRVAADVSRHDERRTQAEAVVHEFNLVTRELNQMKAKANLVHRIDPRIDIASILAEISHLVEEAVVLSKIEFAAELISRPNNADRSREPSVRSVVQTEDSTRELPLGESTLRIVLAGIAAEPAHVADLVCRLDESAYFGQVRPSFYGRTKIQGGSPGVVSAKTSAPGGEAPGMMDVTAFEITCTLANYEEIEGP